MAYFVQKMTLKKKSKNKNNKKAEKILRNGSEINIMDILNHFTPNQRPYFKTVFSKLNFFSVLGSILSKNSCKLSRKLRNAPLRSEFQIFLKIQFRLVP